AKTKVAHVVLGLLYGEGDITSTIESAARLGHDSGHKPATDVEIRATKRSYEGNPVFLQQGLDDVDERDFAHTNISLAKDYDLSFKHALETIERSGTVTDDSVTIVLQPVETAPLEQNFTGHYPVDEIRLYTRVEEEITFDFTG